MSYNKFGKTALAYSLPLLCLSLSLPTISAAEGYQSEVTFSHLSNESDDNQDLSLTGFTGNYYLTPVSSNGKPLAEAAFLEHASHFSATLLSADLSGDVRGDGLAWGIGFTQANKESPWTFSIGLLKTDLDMKSGSAKANFESDSLFVSLGYFLDNDTLVSGEITNIDGSYSGDYSAKEDGKEYTLSFKKVTLLSAETAFNLTASFSKDEVEDDFGTEKGQTVSIAGDYYLSPRTSIGGSLSNRSHDDADLEGQTTGLNITSFVQTNFFLHAALEKFSADSSSGSDEDTWQIAVGYRF